MMKVFFSLGLMVGLLMLVQLPANAEDKPAEPKQTVTTTGSPDEMIAKISQYRQEGEKKIVENKFTRKVGL